MAREATTPEQIESLAAKVTGVGAAIAEIAKQLREDSVPNVRLHLGTLTNVLIPQIQHWLDVAQLNTNDDIRSYLRGAESKSVMQQRYNQKRKRTIAKRGGEHKSTGKTKERGTRRKTSVK